jgi:MGT family glycosyltransferase
MRQLKIIVTGPGLTGHLNPILSSGRILAQAGHEVAAYVPSVFRRQVEANGLAFHAFPSGADVDMRDVYEFFPERKTLPPGYPTRRKTWERMFVERMVEEYEGLQTLLRTFPADLIIAESMCFGTMPLLLGPRHNRPAIIHLGVTFLQLPRDDAAPMLDGLPPARTDEERRDYRKRAAQAQAEWFGPINAVIDGMLARLGRPPLPMPFYEAAIRLPDAFLQTGVPSLEYPNARLPSSLHFIGALLPDTDMGELPDWADDLDGSAKVVLVTQGTLANANLGQLIGATLAGLADEPDLLVVATTGGRSVEALGALPKNARVAKFLPYGWLMPKVGLLITNGGYGTVNHALSLGVPLVVAGTTEDKREVSARITWSGTGISLNTDSPSPQQLREAARQVLDAPAFRTNARRLAQEFAEHDPRRALERLVEALTPRTARHPEGSEPSRV